MSLIFSSTKGTLLCGLIKFISSSIGKKLIMAVTGLCLLLFLGIHVLGNAAIFFGSHAFQTYAHTLHSFPVVVFVFGIGIFVVFLAHIVFGLTLFLQNRATGASRYAVTTRVYKRTWASSTMPYTGLFILLFVLVHVYSFGLKPTDLEISELVKVSLNSFAYGFFYLIAFCVLAFHLSHGVWSMLQTFGINHPRYNGLITVITYAIPIFLLVFFGMIVLYFMTGLGLNY